MHDYEPEATRWVQDIAITDRTIIRPITGRIARVRVFRRLANHAGRDDAGRANEALLPVDRCA